MIRNSNDNKSTGIIDPTGQARYNEGKHWATVEAFISPTIHNRNITIKHRGLYCHVHRTVTPQHIHLQSAASFTDPITGLRPAVVLRFGLFAEVLDLWTKAFKRKQSLRGYISKYDLTVTVIIHHLWLTSEETHLVLSDASVTGVCQNNSMCLIQSIMKRSSFSSELVK